MRRAYRQIEDELHGNRRDFESQVRRLQNEKAVIEVVFVHSDIRKPVLMTHLGREKADSGGPGSPETTRRKCSTGHDFYTGEVDP
jgi:hypothetical protein